MRKGNTSFVKLTVAGRLQLPPPPSGLPVVGLPVSVFASPPVVPSPAAASARLAPLVPTVASCAGAALSASVNPLVAPLAPAPEVASPPDPALDPLAPTEPLDPPVAPLPPPLWPLERFGVGLGAVPPLELQPLQAPAEARARTPTTYEEAGHFMSSVSCKREEPHGNTRPRPLTR